MLPPCNTSSLPDVNASSSLPSHSAISHKQLAPISQDRRIGRKQSLVDCRQLPTVGPDVSQPSDVFSNLTVPATISRFAHSASRTANTGTPTRNLIHPEFVLHARSDNLRCLPSQEQSFPSQRRRVLLMRYHSEPIIRTVPVQTESSSPFFWSSATETQNQQQQRSSQHGITRILPSQTVSADRGSSIADTGDQYASPVVQHPLTLSHPFSNSTINESPRPTGFVAVPSSTTAREDSVYEMTLAENTSEPREYVQCMTDGWKEDAKGVLIFTGIFSAIVASFIIESYKMLSQDVGDQIPLQPSHPPVSIIAVNMMWLISLVLNIVSALFATLTFQWSRRFARVPRVPRAPRDRVPSRSFLFGGTLTYDLDHAVAMTVMLLHLSVFLFLVGLVIFFFNIHKIVATVVTVAVGLFGVVYLMLTVLACIDRSCPYRTPLSDVWWSHRGRQGSTY